MIQWHKAGWRNLCFFPSPSPQAQILILTPALNCLLFPNWQITQVKKKPKTPQISLLQYSIKLSHCKKQEVSDTPHRTRNTTAPQQLYLHTNNREVLWIIAEPSRGSRPIIGDILARVHQYYQGHLPSPPSPLKHLSSWQVYSRPLNICLRGHNPPLMLHTQIKTNSALHCSGISEHRHYCSLNTCTIPSHKCTHSFFSCSPFSCYLGSKHPFDNLSSLQFLTTHTQ